MQATRGGLEIAVEDWLLQLGLYVEGGVAVGRRPTGYSRAVSHGSNDGAFGWRRLWDPTRGLPPGEAAAIDDERIRLNLGRVRTALHPASFFHALHQLGQGRLLGQDLARELADGQAVAIGQRGQQAPFE